MASVFCNQCGHRNPGESVFCSSCGGVLDRPADHTITLAKIDPLQDAPGPSDDTQVHLGDLPAGSASLVVRSGSQTGSTFALRGDRVRLGRHPDSEIALDDITVSRRHAEIRFEGGQHVLHDDGSLNGTYVNAQRVESAVLAQGDEIQIGKFRLIYFERGTNGS